jgi:hypothetical protein
MKQGETITIAWCDSGMVEGQFAESLMKVVVNGILDGLPISSFIRNSGIQIARQRQTVLDDWHDNHKSDWLLWVDSDIILTLDIIENEISFFAENNLKGNDFIGEDVSFFRKCNALKIPIYAHTGAIAQHVKKSPWDLEYYNLYWNKKNNE